MLVLSRKRDQEIVIGADGGVVITVVEVRQNSVRLGVSAPKTTPVHRREVFDRIKREDSRSSE